MMSFNSVNFVLFFIVTCSVYFSLPYRFRWFPLLVASYYFCASWDLEYSVMLLLTTVLDYFLVLRIPVMKNNRWKKAVLTLSITGSLLPLFLFKYLNFFNESFKTIVNLFSQTPDVTIYKWAVPVGISYYTFKKISYAVDVYREVIEPEKHLGKYALYIYFFPTFTAGPIDRVKNLIPQFSCKFDFQYSRVVSGLRLILWGFFKKLVIADNAAVAVNAIYRSPGDYDSLSTLLGILLFSIQLYADFSGYTDMALGIGKILGFRLTENFKSPYFSENITSFWKKWHISLTSWLMDYIFLPVAYFVSRKISVDRALGIKNETWAYVVGTSVTMISCGLWHGAQWNFAIWGAIHSLYMVCSYLTKKKRKKFNKRVKNLLPDRLLKVFRILMTFSFVSVSWVFFRSENVDSAFRILGRITSFESGNSFTKIWDINGFDSWIWLGALIIGVLVHFIIEKSPDGENFSMGRSLLLRWSIYYILSFAILLFGVFGEEKPFIYFNF